jgi:hypothetical protein
MNFIPFQTNKTMKSAINIVRITYIIMFSFLFSGFINAQSGNDWQLKKNENGIVIYTRYVPGSSFKEIKAVTTFNSSLSAIVALIKDAPSHPLWVYNCKQTKMLKMLSDTEFYYYSETSVPWPMSNRDGVVSFKISQDPKTKVVMLVTQNVSGLMAEVPGNVRVPKILATWKLTPQSNGTVLGEYQLNLDPGGAIPAWIANMFATEGPNTSILKMREMLTKDKYKLAVLSYIKE